MAGILDYFQNNWGLTPLPQFRAAQPQPAQPGPAQPALEENDTRLRDLIAPMLGGQALAGGYQRQPTEGILAAQDPEGYARQAEALRATVPGWQPLRVTPPEAPTPALGAAPPAPIGPASQDPAGALDQQALPVPPVPPGAPPRGAAQQEPQPAAGQPPAAAPAQPAPSAPVQNAFGPEQRRSYYAAFETGNAQNPYQVANRAGSSAFGRYQFTRGTYEDIRRRNPQAGLGSWEEFQQNPSMQDRAMDLADAGYQQAAAREGIAFTPFVGRAMHFMGERGGTNFLRAYAQDPSRSAPDWVRQTYGNDAEAVLRQNPGVYTDAQGNPRTIGQVYARLQNAGGGEGGILAGTPNPGVEQPPQPQTGQADRLATTDAGIESNPLYRRIMERLNSRAANDMPLWADLAGRIGTGLLSGNDWQSGFANAGKMALDGVDKRNQRRLSVEDKEIGALTTLLGSDLKARNDRTRTGTPANVNWRGPDGRPINRVAELRDGRYYFRESNGGLTPVEQVTGGNHRIGSRGAADQFEDGPGGIPGAAYVTDLGNGNLLPTFTFQREGEGRSYAFSMAALGARERLRQMENNGYDPTRVSTALEHYFSDGGGAGRAIPEILSRLTGLTDPNDREYARQLLLYTNAVGRFESGAQIPETEFSRYRAMFNPGMLTGPDGIRNAQATRDRHLVPLIGATGSASAYLGQIYSGKRQFPQAGAEFSSGQTEAERPPARTGGAQAATPPASQGGQGTQESPIPLQGRVNPASLEDGKYYRVPSGAVALGKDIKAQIASQRQ